MLKLGLNECSNQEYHADNKFLSSSNLKLLLKDPQQFYKEKILGEREPQKESASFTEGSLTHSLILEPHLVQTEYAFFPGMRKQGAEFDAFAAATPQGKTIISQAQKIRCDSYKDAFRKNPVAVELIKGGESEATICAEFYGVPIKVRCDYINVEKGYIADVKTSSYPVDVDSVKLTLKKWDYPLSAALYTAIASQYYEKDFEFYFLFIGKSDIVCEVYKASQTTLDKGMADIMKAIKIYKTCKETGEWKLTAKKHVPIGEILEV